MAIGPTTNGVIPVPSGPGPNGQRGAVASPIEQRRAEPGNTRNDDVQIEAVEAELLDPVDPRQSDLEQTAEQIRQLNPNAPRGTILNILI